jgi:uncharacterized protein (TIGR03435 family)
MALAIIILGGSVAELLSAQSNSSSAAGTHGPSNGKWRWTRINILRMVADAYDVKWDRVVAIPKTFHGPDTVFNIDAKFPPETSTAQFRLMLQSLLADRFHFSMHRDTRELLAIALEVAKGGLNLKPASGDCVQHPTQAPPLSITALTRD